MKEASVEARLRTLCANGELQSSLCLALERYGRELLGFCHTVLGVEDAADEAFAMSCEDLWRGLPAFRWECTFRVWAYAVARNACARWRSDVWRRRATPQPELWLDELQARVRTETRPYLRTTIKDRLDRLRRSLTPEEQMLLTLRIDRGLAWTEVARVLGDTDQPGEAALRRQAASCRKRFERLKDRLRQLAHAEGLLDEQ